MRYANADRRTVQRAVARLMKLGELEVTVQGGGDMWTEHYERPNRYKVKLACPAWCDRTPAHRDTRRIAGLGVERTHAERVLGARTPRGGKIGNSVENAALTTPTQTPAENPRLGERARVAATPYDIPPHEMPFWSAQCEIRTAIHQSTRNHVPASNGRCEFCDLAPRIEEAAE